MRLRGARGPWAAMIAACLLAMPCHAVDARLQLQARLLVGAGQGVYVEAEDGTVLVAQAAGLPVHPASLSKLATSLALLQAHGPGHRFATTLLADGPVDAGTLAGDLWVQAGGDPFLVDESALRIAQALRLAGIERVAGQLRVAGPLTFDWRGEQVAARMRKALTGGAPPAAWARLQGSADGASEALPPMPRIAIDGSGPAADDDGRTAPASATRLATYESPPLLRMVKALNDYSNNVFAPFAQAAGGVAAVESAARAALPAAWRDEVTLGDGAGMDERNRMSPRATVALLRALSAELARTGHAMADALPVSGIDRGTLEHRLDGEGEAGHVVGKTGTYGDYGASALAGAVRTRAHGVVYFAVLNHGVPVPRARRRQEAFVRALLARWPGEAWPYEPPATEPWADARIVLAQAHLPRDPPSLTLSPGRTGQPGR